MGSETVVFGKCANKFALNLQSLVAVSCGKPYWTKFPCSSKEFRLCTLLRKSAVEQSADGAAKKVEWQCSVSAIINGDSMPGVEARVWAAMLDASSNNALYSSERIQLPLDAFNTNQGIEIFNMTLAEMDKYVQKCGNVIMIMAVEVRKLQPPMDHSAHFLKCLSDIHLSGEFSDVKLICSGRTFRCHKVILAARSVVFANMFKGDFREAKENKVFIDDVSPRTMEVMLRFIYRGDFDRKEASIELLATAHRYDVQGLVRECCNELTFGMDTGNICSILEAAYLYDRGFLFKYAVDFFVTQEPERITQEEGWKELSSNRDVLGAILMETE